MSKFGGRVDLFLDEFFRLYPGGGDGHRACTPSTASGPT